MQNKALLQKGITELGLVLSDDCLAKLMQYLALLQKWNQVYNLTAIDNVTEMVTRHLLDSLAIAPYISEQRIIDVGSGAGLPGIVLALYYPDKDFVLLDSKSKKTHFLLQAKQDLDLANVEIVHERVENYQTLQRFDIVLTRAFSTLGDMLEKTKHISQQDGKFLAMKGTIPQAEMDEIIHNYVVTVNKLTIPGLSAERHLLVIKKG